MFLIIGVNEGEKELLTHEQYAACKCCGRVGRLAVWVRYTYLMLFFIPLFKWNRRYYVKMDCCGARCALDPALGARIARGEDIAIPPEALDFGPRENGLRACAHCGYTTAEAFAYCPKCGRPM